MCMWDDCGMTTTESQEMVRHVHFHAFHARIKARGEQLMAEEGTICKGQKQAFEMLHDRSNIMNITLEMVYLT